MDDIRKPIHSYKEHVYARKKINAYITKENHIGTFDPYVPLFFMDCHNLAIRTCNFFRACGIPVVYEFTPQWPNQDSGHFWCASPDSSHILQPYTPPYNNLREDWKLNLKYAGKVYRINYGASSASPYFLKEKKEIVPDVFTQPTIIDVTERYHTCTDITLPLPESCSNNLAYLCFFNKGKLNPVAWGKVDHEKHTVSYEQIPLNIFFVPAYLAKDKLIPFDKPFLLQKDSITGKIIKKEFVCDPYRQINMHLLRKYPIKPHLADCLRKIKGAYIIASNHEKGPYDMLLVLKDVPPPYWQEYKLNNTRKYRFYWFWTKPKVPINIAEFEFLGVQDPMHICSAPTRLPVFSQPAVEDRENDSLKKITGTPIQAGPLYAKAYDGDYETYIESPYLGMDFIKPVCISHIRFLPRNSNNIVEPDCRYQLLYYKDGEWIVHQTQTANHNYVDFENLPGSTIYWLRNLDKGKEELPFFYEDGKQIFINDFLN